MANGVFATGHLPFAAFLLSTGRLRFIEAKAIEDGGDHISFLFSDPDGLGREIEREFRSGATVVALDFHDALKRCRRLITAAQGGGR